MKSLLSKLAVVLVILLATLNATAQTTIFNETFGTVAANTLIPAHTGWSNGIGLTFDQGGAANAADIRNSSASTGYTGASGNANVFFTSATERGIGINGINAANYTNMTIDFAYRKESTTALPALQLDYWNGTAWVNVPFTFTQLATAGTGWYTVTGVSIPAGAQISNLKIRFVKTGTTTSTRIDDVTLRGTFVNPTLTATGTLTSLYTNQGTPSAPTAFQLDGTNIIGNVTVAAPSNFEVSSDGANYSASISVPTTGGTLTGQIIYVRINQSAPIGTYTGNITVSTTGLADILVPLDATNTVDVATLQSQTISFTLSSPVTYGISPITLNGTSTSGLTVAYASSNTNVATVSGNTLFIVGAGTAIITASQPGDGVTYNPANDVQQTIVVDPAMLTLANAAVTDKIYNGNTVATITGDLVGVVGSDVVALVGTGIFADPNVANGIAVTAICTVSGTNSNNYTLVNPTGLTGNILPASQIVSFTLPHTVVGEGPLTLSASSTFTPLNLSYSSSDNSVATIAGNVLTIVGAGSADITATNPGDANTLSGSATATLIVRNGVAKWDFNALPAPTGTTISSGATFTGAAANLGSNASGSVVRGNHSASTTWSSVTGNGSALSLNSNTWNVNGYYEFEMSTLGFNQLFAVWDQMGSGTGPKDFELFYSVDGTNFITTGYTYTVTNDSWTAAFTKPISTKQFDLSSITALNGQANVKFRLVNTSTVSVGNATVAAGGTNRVDNFTIAGTPCPAEVCNDGIDNDCDGLIDENCPTINLTSSTSDFCPTFSGTLNFATTNFTQSYTVNAYLVAANGTTYTSGDLVGTASNITGNSGSISINLNGASGATDYNFVLVATEANTGYFAVDNNTNTIVNSICADYGCMDVTACNYDALATIDDASCTYPSLWYLDADADGYYVSSTSACSSPGVTYTAVVGISGDCNDSNAAVNAGVTEILCNLVDDNCNGATDEGAVVGCTDVNASNYNAATTCPDNTMCTYGNYTAGNIVALRTGAGSTTLGTGGTAIFLEEMSTTGVAGTIAIPTTGANRQVMVGNSTLENMITLSPDKSKLIIPGYDASTLQANLTGSAAPRVIGTQGIGYNSFNRVASGTIYSSPTAGNFRSACTDGTNYWTTGSTQGVQYYNGSSFSIVSSNITNLRAINIFGNQLYYATASTTGGALKGIYKVGTGLPTTTVTATNEISVGAGGDPYGFYFNNDQTVCYIADNTNGVGIQKWILTNGIWTLDHAVSVGASSGARSVVVDFYAGVNPRVYAVTGTSTTTSVVWFDDTGANATLNTIATYTTATDNKAYRSVAFAPCTPSMWYADADADGFGSAIAPLSYCTQPYGYVANSTDCDDTNAGVNPTAAEVCNAIDDNCDTQVDNGLTFSNYYADTDADGFGAGSATNACSQPTGFVTTSNDCNDTNAAVNPAATESCSTNYDDDCDALVNEGCSSGNQAGDNPSNAVNTVTAFWPSCSATSHTLVGYSPSANAQTTCLTGEDKWHSFTANSEAVSIQVASTENDIVIELQTAAGLLVAQENAVTGLGGEILNIDGLVAGQIYKVGVRNYNSASGIGTYSICVRSLKRGGCDSGNNPIWSNTLNLCKVYKASWAGSGAQYRFTFVGTSGPANGNTYIRTQSSDYLSLANVNPTLPLGSSYVVNITNIYNLTDGAGNAEVVEVSSIGSCTLNLEAAPATSIRASDRCSNGPRFRGAIVASLPWSCGVNNWKWEFVQVDAGNNPVGLPIIHYRGAASNYLNLALVTALQYGTTYAVRTAPVYSWGEGAYGPVQYMCIIGQSGMIAEGANAQAGDDVKVSQDLSQNLNVYPNPTNGSEINIQLSNITSENVQVRVLDAMGRVVFANRYAVDGMFTTNMTFDRPLVNGLYMIEASFNGEVLTQRMMVQK
jgi:hypothetical protein